ncbi:MAG: TatD family hydrolase [Treponemataceae bacterium]
MFVDAHLHIYDLAKAFDFKNFSFETLKETYICASSHKFLEFEFTKNFCLKNKLKAFYSFGLHPQNPTTDELANLEKLLMKKEIHIIGETGFDLFNSSFEKTFKEQLEVWHIQIELAQKFNLPVLLHLRKANHLIFENIKDLKKLPSVVFHSWSGSAVEANCILKRGVNAYFSLGKALLRGQKNVVDIAKNFPLEYILTETDAPYMQLKDEVFSLPKDIIAVTKKIAALRTEDDFTKDKNTLSEKFLYEQLLPQVQKNFLQIFKS